MRVVNGQLRLNLPPHRLAMGRGTARSVVEGWLGQNAGAWGPAPLHRYAVPLPRWGRIDQVMANRTRSSFLGSSTTRETVSNTIVVRLAGV